MIGLFGRSLNKNFKGKLAMVLSLRTVLLIVLVFIPITQSALKTTEMYNETALSILQVKEYQQDPASVNLSEGTNFVFAFAATVDGRFINMSSNSILTFNAVYRQYRRNPDGSRTKLMSAIYFAPCNASDFDKVLDNDTFTKYSLEYAFCPTGIDYSAFHSCPSDIVAQYPDCIVPPDFDIAGSYLSDTFEFIQFNVSRCDDPSKTLPYGVTCDTIDNVERVFETSEVRWNLYYTNNVVNPESHDNPFVTYLDSTYWDLNTLFFTVTDILLDQETIQDTEGLINAGQNHSLTSYSIDSSKNREQYLVQNSSISPLRSPLLQWNLRRSNFDLMTIRTYKDVQDEQGIKFFLQ